MSYLTTPGIIPRNKTTTIYGIQEVKSSIEAGYIYNRYTFNILQF